MSHPAIFLDKDGTLIENVPYNVDPERIILGPGVSVGVRQLFDAGYRLVVVSNQSGVARGLFSETALVAVHDRLEFLLKDEAGADLSGFFYCPHHPEGTVDGYSISCLCRKPQPGMLLRAAQELDIDLSHSWMIGDILDDIEAGRRAGCTTILIANGNETDWIITPMRQPHFIVSNLSEAARTIQSILAVQNVDLSQLLVD